MAKIVTKHHVIPEDPEKIADIVTKHQVIPKEIADAAYKSLDNEVDRKRREGALEARKKLSAVKLEWTTLARKAARAFDAVYAIQQLKFRD